MRPLQVRRFMQQGQGGRGGGRIRSSYQISFATLRGTKVSFETAARRQLFNRRRRSRIEIVEIPSLVFPIFVSRHVCAASLEENTRRALVHELFTNSDTTLARNKVEANIARCARARVRRIKIRNYEITRMQLRGSSAFV